MPFNAGTVEDALSGTDQQKPRGFNAAAVEKALAEPAKPAYRGFNAAAAEKSLAGAQPSPQATPKVTPQRTPLLRPVAQWGAQRARNAADAMQWIGGSPLGRGVDAVLGAPQRAEQSAIVEGNPLKGVFNPEGSMAVTHQLEHKALDRPLAAMHAQVPTQGWGQAALDFATQTLTDPQTQLAILATIGAAIPGVDAVAGPAAAVLDPIAWARAGARAARIAGEASGGGRLAGALASKAPENLKNFVEKAKGEISTSHKPLKGYTPAGLNLDRARAGNMRLMQHQRLGEYHAALDTIPRKDIDNLDAAMRRLGLNSSDLRDNTNYIRLPVTARQTLSKINQVTDKALWREGTPEVRRSMRARGFKPTAAEANLPSSNLISTDFGKRYLPEQEVYDEAARKELQGSSNWSYTRGGVKRSRYDISKNNLSDPQAPLYDRLTNRLESAAYLEPKRRFDQTMIRELGLEPSQAPRTAERMTELQKRIDLTPKADLLLRRLTPVQRDAAEQVLRGEADVVADPQVMAIVRRVQNADARRGALQRHLDRYKGLLGRQTTAAAENVQRQTRYLRPDAAMKDAKISGVLRGEKEATAKAIRDSGFLGKALDAAFTDKGEQLGRVSTGAATERANRMAIEARRAQQQSEHARKNLRKSGESLAKETARAAKAVGKGQETLGRQAEKGYDAAMKAQRNLTAGLKNVPGLSEERPVGYAREFQGAGALGEQKFDPETQRLLNRRGQALRGKIDPAYEALLRATQAKSISRPFQETATQVSRIGGKGTTKPLADVADRLAKNADVRQQAARNAASEQNRRFQRNTAVSALEKRLASDPRYQGAISMPSAVHDRLFGPKVYQQPNFLGDIGNTIARATFSVPTPHFLGNILGQQRFAGGGPKSIYQGLVESYRLARKDPEALKRLEEAQRHGALYEHGYEEGMPEVKGKGILPALARLPRQAQHALTVGDQGQVSTLYQKYLKAGMSPEDAAEETRKTFGRPHEYSELAHTLRRSGGPFVNWETSTVPRSTKKMLSSRASRNALEEYARFVRDANTDVLEPQYGVEWNPGGFASRAAQLLFKPSWYFASASLDNPIHSFASESEKYPSDVVESVIPYVGAGKDIVSQPLTDAERARGGYKKLPWWMRALSASHGGYFTHAESHNHAIRRELQRRGLLGP